MQVFMPIPYMMIDEAFYRRAVRGYEGSDARTCPRVKCDFFVHGSSFGQMPVLTTPVTRVRYVPGLNQRSPGPATLPLNH